MKVLIINTVCGTGSTGRISVDIYNVLKQNGDECKIAYGRGEARGIPECDAIKIGGTLGIYAHAFLSRITDKSGFYSSWATKRFIKQIEEYNPDVIHLHNIHGYYINVELLFKYLAKANKKVVWTLHDCWSFTGHCAYFDYVVCDKWENGCRECPQIDSYPKSYIDGSKRNYKKKKEIFTKVKDLTIVTPCRWLADNVKRSYLAHYPVRVIYNGIDFTRFKPVESDFREKHGLQSKKIILAVANIWEPRKGFGELLKLKDILGDGYKIVVVGNPGDNQIPEDMIHIARTNSQAELAELYSAADVFVIPSFEDNFPTVNIEALACGTPVISYNTGGSPEAADETCGITVENAPEAMAAAIVKLDKYGFTKEACLKRAEYFDKNERFKEYLTLYNN